MMASGFLPVGTSAIVLRVFKSKIVTVEDCPDLCPVRNVEAAISLVDRKIVPAALPSDGNLSGDGVFGGARGSYQKGAAQNQKSRAIEHTIEHESSSGKAFREVPEIYLNPQSELEAHHELQLPRQTGASVRRRGVVIVIVEVHRGADKSEVAGRRQIRWT
jgi:hypothetical protein